MKENYHTVLLIVILALVVITFLMTLYSKGGVNYSGYSDRALAFYDGQSPPNIICETVPGIELICGTKALIDWIKKIIEQLRTPPHKPIPIPPYPNDQPPMIGPLPPARPGQVKPAPLNY